MGYFVPCHFRGAVDPSFKQYNSLCSPSPAIHECNLHMKDRCEVCFVLDMCVREKVCGRAEQEMRVCVRVCVQEGAPVCALACFLVGNKD